MKIASTLRAFVARTSETGEPQRSVTRTDSGCCIHRAAGESADTLALGARECGGALLRPRHGRGGRAGYADHRVSSDRVVLPDEIVSVARAALAEYAAAAALCSVHHFQSAHVAAFSRGCDLSHVGVHFGFRRAAVCRRKTSAGTSNCVCRDVGGRVGQHPLLSPRSLKQD